jgi:hypothetical protein
MFWLWNCVSKFKAYSVEKEFEIDSLFLPVKTENHLFYILNLFLKYVVKLLLLNYKKYEKQINVK